jgi:hypothetical protein
MTLAELARRVSDLEDRLDQLAAPASVDVNAWIDQVHGTFQPDADYRRAARFGRQWRRSEGGQRVGPRPRTAAK